MWDYLKMMIAEIEGYKTKIKTVGIKKILEIFEKLTILSDHMLCETSF